jgi:hypothetical protein
MNAFRFTLALAMVVSGAARAQLLDPLSQSTLEAQPSREAKAFAKIPAPFEPTYMRNEAERPNAHLFPGYRSDPRLVAGINLNRYLALEAGYRERKDRGFHKIDEGDPTDKAGALGVKGFHSYAAVKATVQLSDDLSAYGKLGVAYSERRGPDAVGKRDQDIDVGPYAKLGVQYKLNEKASVTAEGQNFGNTAQKWGSGTNGNGVNAKLNLGF